MGCADLFHDKFEELGVLLKEYEQSINMMAREEKLDLIKTDAELSIDEKKGKIRMILAELNKYFDEEPEDFRFDRFKKLNEKFQYLLNEESNVLHEKVNGENLIDDDFKANRRYIYTQYNNNINLIFFTIDNIIKIIRFQIFYFLLDKDKL